MDANLGKFQAHGFGGEEGGVHGGQGAADLQWEVGLGQDVLFQVDAGRDFGDGEPLGAKLKDGAFGDVLDLLAVFECPLSGEGNERRRCSRTWCAGRPARITQVPVFDDDVFRARR